MNVMAMETLDSGGNGETRFGIWGEKEDVLKSEDGARSEALINPQSPYEKDTYSLVRRAERLNLTWWIFTATSPHISTFSSIPKHLTIHRTPHPPSPRHETGYQMRARQLHLA